MNDYKSIGAALILSVGIVLSGYFISRTYIAGKELDRTVTVKGLAEREVEADLATWTLQLTLSGNDLSSLQKTLERQTKILTDFLKSMKFSESEISVGAPSIQDNRAQLYGGQSSYNRDRYITFAEFNLRTSEIEKIKNTMNEIPSIIGQGLVIGSKNDWQPVQYLYTKLNEIKPEMIEEATKNARAAAEKFARDSGSKVGKIKSARQGLFTISDLYVDSGIQKKVRIVSTIEFYIED